MNENALTYNSELKAKATLWGSEKIESIAWLANRIAAARTRPSCSLSSDHYAWHTSIDLTLRPSDALHIQAQEAVKKTS